MKSFKQKIVISDIVLFLFFTILLFFLVNKSVNFLIKRSYYNRVQMIIDELKESKDFNEFFYKLNDFELRVFYRISLIDNEGNLLYDSHYHKLPREKDLPHYYLDRKEIIEAKNNKVGYREAKSQIFSEIFTYVAKSFSFDDKNYFLRTSFPIREIEQITRPFQIIFIAFAIAFLLIYSFMTGIIVLWVTRPIQYIINSIKPYQEGREEKLPQINIPFHCQEFVELSQMVNSLSKRLKNQIERLVEQRNENEAILQSLEEGIVAIDNDYRVTFANEMAIRILTKEKEKLLGENFQEFTERYKCSVLEECNALLSICMSEGTLKKKEIEIDSLKKMNLVIVASPQKHGALLFFQDKTADYKVIAMGKNFVANASHELRTPITVIQGFAETLQDIPNLSKKMLKDILNKIIRTSQRLSSIVKNLLTLEEVEHLSGQSFVPCSLADIIENCKDLLLASHNNLNIEVRIKKQQLHVFGEAGLIELAISNLLENAVKYSPSPASIEVVIDEFINQVILKIKDKGIGIPKVDEEHVFDRFFTVDKARSRRYGGTGLGLSLVKTIVEKHGGQISVSSKVNKGSCFTISLPKYEKV